MRFLRILSVVKYFALFLQILFTIFKKCGTIKTNQRRNERRNNAMKRNVIKLTVCFLLLCFAFSFASCIKSDEARNMAEQMFACLSEGRYEDALALCHPASGITEASELESLVKQVNEYYEVDVSEGIVIDKVTGVKSSAYNTSVDGSAYQMNMSLLVGETKIASYIIIVKNDDGFGVAGIHFG